MAATIVTTLYPKITNHIDEIAKTWKEVAVDSVQAMPIVGTVKLHGTHADILVYNDNRLVFQSRNIVGLQISKDNVGFATCMAQKTKPLLRLRDFIVARFTQLNPSATIDSDSPVLIAGEWIGEKIQKDVAISQLSKRFVIISININGKWQRDSDYGFIALPNHNIYNISRAGVFSRVLYSSDPLRTAAELLPLAEQVATKCPFATTFGLDGGGEGIVWKPALDPYNSNPALWFKTKGGRFKPTFARAPRQAPETAEQNREAAADVAKTWTSQARLEQGLEYLKEYDVKPDIKGLTQFLKWIQNDVAVEEKGWITAHKIDSPSLRIEIAKIAKPWYVQRLKK
ncbi:hypothetical protein GQ44DRAFT_288134 [Phaeosphaeriaceae sp. PMI808]|nr:hypothetical protein GQ44DRAFT_288134 [Phaeosphaeriaceae sp. PMI808]